MDRAVGLAAAVLEGWAPVFKAVTLVSSSQGRFEVTLDGELIFSKTALGRHANDGEVTSLIREQVGPEVFEG